MRPNRVRKNTFRKIANRHIHTGGGQVILWGASLLDREPGAVHHWHTDIECAAPEARTVSVWIGLENTTPKSSLDLLKGRKSRPMSLSLRYGLIHSLNNLPLRSSRSRPRRWSAKCAVW